MTFGQCKVCRWPDVWWKPHIAANPSCSTLMDCQWHCACHPTVVQSKSEKHQSGTDKRKRCAWGKVPLQHTMELSILAETSLVRLWIEWSNELIWHRLATTIQPCVLKIRFCFHFSHLCKLLPCSHYNNRNMSHFLQSHSLQKLICGCSL